MSPDDLLRKLHDRPFRPFRLKLTTNETIDLHSPHPVIVGETSAIIPISVRKSDQGFELVERWKTIALSHIVSFQDLESDNGKNGRKRSKR